MTLLQFKNINYIDDNKPILRNISIDITSGDFISIVGHSGSGKSTFLKLCSHLINPSNGDMFYNNKNFYEYNPTDLRKKISYCFQTPYLFEKTVMDNLSFPYFIRNLEIDIRRIEELFSMFKLDMEFLNKDVTNLSGGEKQRIALIRTLIFKPDILLLDEVTSALDTQNTIIVENVIKALNDDGITILWITHNSEQSRKHANKILTIENGEIKCLEVLK